MPVPQNNDPTEVANQYRVLVKKTMAERKLSYNKATIAVNNSAEGGALLAKMKKPQTGIGNQRAKAIADRVVTIPVSSSLAFQRNISMYSNKSSVEEVSEMVTLLFQALKAADAGAATELLASLQKS